MDIHFRSLQFIRVLLLYRPPDNTFSMLFLEEFSVLLEQTMAESTGHLLISGDFNLHVDDRCDIYAWAWDMGLSKGKYALGLPLRTSQFAAQSFAVLLRLPRRK